MVMKMIITLLMLVSSLLAQKKGPGIEELDELRVKHAEFLQALATVESGGKDSAVGDDGKAIGRYQVWETYWSDAVAFAPAIGGKYSDCTDKVYAERVLMAYFLRYGKKAMGRQDYEVLSRIHNGGQAGAKRKATLPYWKKVQKAMDAAR
jgi:hypothetical protein